MLYQLSYFRVFNCHHSLKKKMATRRGLEPLTSAVTGRHSNQLNYRAVFYLLPTYVTTIEIIYKIGSLVNSFFEKLAKK